MKILATLAAVAAMAVASSAVAGPLDGFYAQGTVGGQFQDQRNDGVAYSAALGKDFGNIRAEVEYTGSRGANSGKVGDVASNLVSVNAYIEPITVLGATPYVGAGVGYGQLYHGGVVGDRSGVVFNGTAGVSYPLTEKLTVLGQYRYSIAKDVEVLKAGGKAEAYRASTASVGLRYAF